GAVLRIGDRRGFDERGLERRGGADVRLWRTGADADAELRASQVRARRAQQLALRDEIVNRLGRNDGDVEGLAGFDSLLQRRGGTELDREATADRLLDLRLKRLGAALHAVGHKRANRRGLQKSECDGGSRGEGADGHRISPSLAEWISFAARGTAGLTCGTAQ